MKLKIQLMVWMVLSVASIIFFQNCGQQGSISLEADPAKIVGETVDICQVNPSHPICNNTAAVGRVEEYRYIDVKQPQVPDLKIFLVLDNSDSMRVSQVNLVSNIEKMFSENGEGLRDYNSEIFILTTGQLNNIDNKLFKTSIDFKNDYQKILENLYSVQTSNATNSLLSFLRPLQSGVIKTNGLLAGDMVGFYSRQVRTPSSVAPIYDAFEVNFYPAFLSQFNQPSILSVKFNKGGSVAELVSRLKERVELLNPDNQILAKSIAIDGKSLDNTPLSDVVEKESGMCALGRIIHEAKNNPTESLIKKGELATFILVSDEEEHDLLGAECIKKFKYQQPLPGTYYRGICADNEANVSYETPDKRDWMLQVQKPYVKNIRQAQEHVNGEILKVDGQCGVKFKQTHARLKVNKNSHKVIFSRKVVDGTGSTVVRSWSHNLSFNRINKQHKYTFDRVALKHKFVFDRTSLKHRVTANRKLITPIFNVSAARRLISKYQRVNYIRKTMLTKEGSKIVETGRTGPLTIDIPGVNIDPSACTPSWIAARSEIKSLEPALASASESYQYEVSSCAVANVTKNESFNKDYSGISPTTCDINFVESVFLKSVMQSNDSYVYDSYQCTQKAVNVVNFSFVSGDIAGDVSAVPNCDASYANSKDSTKPVVNASIGQVLSYENPNCSAATTTDIGAQILNLAGSCSLVSNLDSEIAIQDGNRTNTTYAHKNCVDTHSTALAQTRTELGVYGGTACETSIASLESNPAYTSYVNCSVVATNTTNSNQNISNISGQYSYTNDPTLLTYIRVKDGNKSVATTDYTLVGAGYVNNPTYENSTGLQSASIDGKKPGVCDSTYAAAKDPSPPSLAAGTSLVYYNVSCSDNSPVTYQLTRSGKTIKYDGSYGNLLLNYDSSLSVSRVCTASEQGTILSNESAATPSMIPDGNVLEVSSCIVSNADLVSATVESNNIISLVNAVPAVKIGATSTVCESPIASYCAVGAINNPTGKLGCQNNLVAFVPYVAYKAESRKYVLRAPEFDSLKNELHWFGFEPIQVTIGGTNTTISLLNLTCEEVYNACGVDPSNNAMTVEAYFKKTYAGNDNTLWANIKKISYSDKTVSDPDALAIACAPDKLIDYVGPSDSRKDYEVCNNKSVNASKSFDIVYDSVLSDIIITKNINEPISCNEVCTVEKCQAKTGSRDVVPMTVTESGVTRPLTMNEFYGTKCTVNPTYTVSTQLSRRSLAKINLGEMARDLATYNNNADVCELTCKQTGLCKALANSPVDVSDKTIKQFVAGLNGLDAAKVSSCRVIRATEDIIEGKATKAEVDTACTNPFGPLLVNKYIKNKYYEAYYSASMPNGKNEVVHIKENQSGLDTYIANSFNDVFGDGFVSMASFSSQEINNLGKPKGSDYDNLARSVNGVVRDVKASSNEYGDALKFLGEKVTAQLKSTFLVTDVAPGKEITRVWFSSWATKGKYVQLNPTDFSASAATIVITNPDIIEKMRTETNFKFFVEIY